MTESQNLTFLTALPPDDRVIIDQDEDSSARPGNAPASRAVLVTKTDDEDMSAVSSTPTLSHLPDELVRHAPISSEPLHTVISRSVYDYAGLVHEKMEGSSQNKLDHDITAILGSSDPPPGFGFLHPRFYYLEQNRPVPMDPLRVRIRTVSFTLDR